MEKTSFQEGLELSNALVYVNICIYVGKKLSDETFQRASKIGGLWARSPEALAGPLALGPGPWALGPGPEAQALGPEP